MAKTRLLIGADTNNRADNGPTREMSGSQLQMHIHFLCIHKNLLPMH